jgi:tRNA dimethylallyltransferase
LGLLLAEAVHGEIVSADSMQVYIHMDIGTDKPPSEVRQRIRHHGIDLVYPDQSFNAAQYRHEAVRAIEAITASGKQALVVGGTGLYLRALLHGLFVCPPIPQEIRTTLWEERKQQGASCLYGELKRVDPLAASRIHPNDSLRTFRALEVYRTTGRRISELQRAHGFSPASYRVLKMAIDVDRAELYRRIEDRVDRMIDRGLVQEVQRLFEMEYDRTLRSMQSIGYRQVGMYLHGELSLGQATEFIKRASRRYAKRQATWFKHDSEVCWLRGKRIAEEALCRVKNFLKV